MKNIITTIILLTISNTFMLFAWYGHLKNLKNKPLIIAILASWSIALLEYIFQVPANRIGHQVLSVGRLKIIQEVITLTVFIPFSIFFMKEKITIDYIISSLFILLAVFFLFRKSILM